jgi:hypothetical protein
MNMYTVKIAKRLKTSIAKAELVQDFIDSYIQIDWSEATSKEIIQAIDEAASTMNFNSIRKVTK